MSEIKISFPLVNGWAVDLALLPEHRTPIALVELRSGSDATRVRFDLDKGMAIDRPNAPEAVARALRERSEELAQLISSHLALSY